MENILFFFFFFNLTVPYLSSDMQDLFFFTATGPFSCVMQILCCSMWDLVPWPGIKPRPPALGVWNLNHWTTREVPNGEQSYVLIGRCRLQSRTFTFLGDLEEASVIATSPALPPRKFTHLPSLLFLLSLWSCSWSRVWCLVEFSGTPLAQN